MLVATGGAVSRAIGERVVSELDQAGMAVELQAGLTGTLAEAARLLERLDEAPRSLMVAVGGGQPIDVAKLASCRADVALVAVPTILSHDGMASPVASLTGSDGERRSVGARMPAGVVIDLDVVSGAPERYVRAGIGDLTSNLTAVEDWRAQADHREGFDEFAASIALLGAKAALDVSWPLHGDDLASVARGLVMSGLAMEVAGSSRPCSGRGAPHQPRPGSGARSRRRSARRAGGPRGAHHGCAPGQPPHHSDPSALQAHRPARPGEWGIDELTLIEAVRLAPSTRPGRRTVLDTADLSGEGAAALIRQALEGEGP